MVTEEDAESRIWRIFEKVFCFLRGLPVYHVRRRLMVIMISQAILCTFRIVPIILGLNYQSTVPVIILVRNMQYVKLNSMYLCIFIK